MAGPYIKRLRRTLELALLDSSDPAYEPRRIDVHVGDHSQVNLAQDSATIHAQQDHVQEGAKKVLELTAALLAAAKAERDEEAEEVATAVLEEVRKPKPRLFTLEGAVGKLKLPATAGESGQLLATQAQTLLPYLERFLTALRIKLGV